VWAGPLGPDLQQTGGCAEVQVRRVNCPVATAHKLALSIFPRRQVTGASSPQGSAVPVAGQVTRPARPVPPPGRC